MSLPSHSNMAAHIIDQAKTVGAPLGGVASVAQLKEAPSYQVSHEAPYYAGFKGIT